MPTWSFGFCWILWFRPRFTATCWDASLRLHLTMHSRLPWYLKLFLAFFMVSLYSPSSGSMKEMPLSLRALSSFGFSNCPFLLFLSLICFLTYSNHFGVTNNQVWKLLCKPPPSVQCIDDLLWQCRFRCRLLFCQRCVHLRWPLTYLDIAFSLGVTIDVQVRCLWIRNLHQCVCGCTSERSWLRFSANLLALTFD